jgi:hypothetical protein
MDITKMIAELRDELVVIDSAILALEQVALGGRKRRGRPPKWMSQAAAPAKYVRSPETRRRMAAAQRKRWAAK